MFISRGYIKLQQVEGGVRNITNGENQLLKQHVYCELILTWSNYRHFIVHDVYTNILRTKLLQTSAVVKGSEYNSSDDFESCFHIFLHFLVLFLIKSVFYKTKGKSFAVAAVLKCCPVRLAKHWRGQPLRPSVMLEGLLHKNTEGKLRARTVRLCQWQTVGPLVLTSKKIISEWYTYMNDFHLRL